MSGTPEMSVPVVPRALLFGNPERFGARIAPDGQRLAWVAPDEGVLNLWVAPVGDVPGGGRAVTCDRGRGVRTCFWAADNRHLLYLQDRDGDENWRLHAVDLDTGKDRDLTPFAGTQARVLDIDRRFADEVLVGLNRDDPQLHDVYRIDLRSGALTKVADNPGFVQWIIDRRWHARGGVTSQPDGGMAVRLRDGNATWRTVIHVPPEDTTTTHPLDVTAGGALIAISSVGADSGRLLRLHGDTVEVLAEQDGADVADVRVHPVTREPQLVAFERERLHWRALDPDLADDLRAVQALDPGDLTLTGRDHADRYWLAAFAADDGPVRFYRYDRATRDGTLLFTHQPALADLPLATMEPFSVTARDGLSIHGYLTFPPGIARRGLPAVVLVHGGPWLRDSWGFHPEAQWLANRGYVCIQVNYRGSTGYGKAFVAAGDRQWGARMHDDLIDALDVVAGQGLVDPGRVGIFGASYGGYAALAGAAFTPDRFACAVDVVGPSNLLTFIASIPPYWKPLVSYFHTHVGDPEADADMLWARSPLSRVDDIRMPLLIAHGANDPRVTQQESEQIVAALRAKGIDHEYLLFDDEGHGLARPENRLRFYAIAERFLARHLGGRLEP